MNNYDNEKKGALWLKTSKNGLKYMSGDVIVNGQRYYISVFKNNNKQSEKHPDYNLVLKIPENQGFAPKTQPQQNNFVNQPNVAQQNAQNVQQQFGGQVQGSWQNNQQDEFDSIPF